MIQRIVAGQASKITFYFYDNAGNTITVTSPTATLYTTIGATAVDTNISISSGVSNQYYVIYTPGVTLSGTYYMVASGLDTDNVTRYSTKFLEIIEPQYNRSLLTVEDVLKYVDSEIVDNTLLEPLIWTASEWVENYIGGVIFPTTITKEYYQPVDLKELRLNYTPVIQVDAIYSCIDGGDDVEVDNTSYNLVDYDTGLIKLNSAYSIIGVTKLNSAYSVEYKVSYVAGFNPIPDTIYTAVGLLVGQLYNKIKYQNITRLKIETISATIDKDAINQIKEMLIPFRKVN